MRPLRPGTLVSYLTAGTATKLDKLKENFAAVLDDESRFPQLVAPPQIRQVFQAHPFGNITRQELDTDRNTCTREMTRHFCDTYEGGVFTAWRASIDYRLSSPQNPEAVVGQRIVGTFDGALYEGVIVKYKKPWWKVQYDDGDQQDATYRELAALVRPPNFDVFR